MVLFAHERPGVGRAVRRILELHGFDVHTVRDGHATQLALEARRWDALVVDVALPGIPGYELVRVAKSLADAGPHSGAPRVVLVSSVYRRTAYKRRPTRLYGADDYVEVHHLGDFLPVKLRSMIGMPVQPSTDPSLAEGQVAAVLRAEGDTRMTLQDREGLASLIVADMVLYNGDRILTAADAEAAATAVREDLEMARDLFQQVVRAEGRDLGGGDPVGDAFFELMSALGREGRS